MGMRKQGGRSDPERSTRGARIWDSEPDSGEGGAYLLSVGIVESYDEERSGVAEAGMGKNQLEGIWDEGMAYGLWLMLRWLTCSWRERNLRLLFVISLVLQSCAAISSLKVATTVGTVYGLINGTTPNVAQFLGIPFAEPPIGSLRFAAPIAKAPVASIDATSLGASCPQTKSSIPSVYSIDSPNLLISGPTSEDCLTLNIWAPVTSKANSARKLPVVVWIYGGNFQTGGGNTGYQIPSQWVERSQAHIVVGINYRGNFFGFPNAAGLVQSDLNVGLLDQRLGLEFVRSNIAAFGGDPARITLWGQSAGALSVDYYNFAYPSDPIISGLIMDSGTALYPSVTLDPTHSNFTYVANQLGCHGLSPIAELACMRNVSIAAIESFFQAYGNNGSQPLLSFNPITDNRTKFTNYTARTLAKNFTQVPAIVGTNTNEGANLVSWNPNGPNMTNADEITIGGFLCPAVQTAVNRYAVSIPTFQYLYDGNFSNISPRPWEGAYHSAELPLIFGTSDIAHGPSTDFELALSHKMQDLYLAFISDPVRGLPAHGWNAYKPNGVAVEFGKNGTLVGSIKSSVLASVCNGAAPISGATPPS